MAFRLERNCTAVAGLSLFALSVLSRASRCARDGSMCSLRYKVSLYNKPCDDEFGACHGGDVETVCGCEDVDEVGDVAEGVHGWEG